MASPDPPPSQKVAVIIVTYNAGTYLDRCLATLYAQSFLPSSVVLVDNASSDGAVNGVAERYPNIQVVRLAENIGFAAANNLGVERAGDCDYIALLNPDAFAEPNWLAELVDAAGRYPKADMFASRMRLADSPDLLDGAGDALHVSGRPWRIAHGAPVERGGLVETEVFAPCAAAALYRAASFRRAGGLDNDFFCYMEDIDLGFRMRLNGGSCVYVPSATVDHVGSVSTVRYSDFYLYHSHRNIVTTFVKNMPGRLFWLHLPMHLLVNLATLFFYALKGRGGVLFKAKVDAIRALGATLAKRRSIQASSTAEAATIRNALTGGLPRPPVI